MSEIYIYNESCNGGTNNLWVARDTNGVVGTSLISKEKAVKSYKRKLHRWMKGRQCVCR